MAMNRLPEDGPYMPIESGVSLLNTSVMAMLQTTTTARACVVKVVNHTRWKLESAGVYMRGGTQLTTQCNVKPGTAEAFVVEKYNGTATSCYGTASFEVKELGRLQFVTIMWSVPFDRNIYSTRLGIEVSKRFGSATFDQMYNDEPNKYKKTQSATEDFRGELVPLRVETKELVVRGTIGNGPKTEAVIDVYEVEGGD